MSISSSVSGDTLKITISGRFDFTLHKDFREAYSKQDTKPSKYTIDLSNTDYMDSSALGMLLLLREFAGGDSSNISITGCNNEIKEIIEISNFDRLFTIS